MKNIAIVGAGNIGLYAAKALSGEKDMRLCAFIRRKSEPVKEFKDIPAVCCVEDLPGKPDGAIICVPSRNVGKIASSFLEKGIATVDAFDIHSESSVLREKLRYSAETGNTVSITGAGWDPGLDSAIRILFSAASPEGTTYTDFGPGISMGHSAAVRSLEGVSDAVSVTLPLGFGKHRRKVYVAAENPDDSAKIRENILADDYFTKDETEVSFVNDVSVLKTNEHGVLIRRSGASAGSCNQRFEYRALLNNPAATAQLLVSAMRSAFRMESGAYFFAEIPPAFLIENYEGLI